MIWDAVKKQIEKEYGRSIVEIEAAIGGMEVTGFFPTKEHDTYLSANAMRSAVWCTTTVGAPRLHLRPKPRRRILLLCERVTRCLFASCFVGDLRASVGEDREKLHKR
jgi:hypothetical protein